MNVLSMEIFVKQHNVLTDTQFIEHTGEFAIADSIKDCSEKFRIDKFNWGTYSVPNAVSVEHYTIFPLINVNNIT